MTFDKRHAQYPVLCEPNEGFVGGIVAVGVVFTGHFTDDVQALDGPAVGMQAEIVIHRVEDTTLHRLEAVANIRQGS